MCFILKESVKWTSKETLVKNRTLTTIAYSSLGLWQLLLTKHQNDCKIELKSLEDDLLLRLSAAEGSFLGDTQLVERLETTKATAAEIEHKVGKAEGTGGFASALCLNKHAWRQA